MPDVAASVLARLKNKANESGRTYQLCLQLLPGGISAPIEESKYAENLVLKRGGLFIYTITDFDSRDNGYRLSSPESAKHTGAAENCAGGNYFRSYWK